LRLLKILCTNKKPTNLVMNFQPSLQKQQDPLRQPKNTTYTPQTLKTQYCQSLERVGLNEWGQPDLRDSNSYAFVGYDQTYLSFELTKQVFSPENISKLSAIITELTKDCDPYGRKIVVPPERIAQVLSSVFRDGRRTHVGDIYTKYIIPQQEARDDLDNINRQTLNIIISTIRNEFDTIRNNQQLSVWTTVLGDFNEHGLRSHDVLKIRRHRPQPMMFNMNY